MPPIAEPDLFYDCCAGVFAARGLPRPRVLPARLSVARSVPVVMVSPFCESIAAIASSV